MELTPQEEDIMFEAGREIDYDEKEARAEQAEQRAIEDGSVQYE